MSLLMQHLLALTVLGVASSSAAQSAISGQELFARHCQSCHASGNERIPPVASLRERSVTAILDALTTGSMQPQGSSLSEVERRAVAAFLAAPAPAASGTSAAACRTVAPFNGTEPPLWAGWGPEITNTRFQTAVRAGLSAATVPRLTLKWAFGFPEVNAARTQPTVGGGRVFTSSPDGTVYSLDVSTGCQGWAFKAKSGVRTGIVIGPAADAGAVAYFGDGAANVYALNAATGALLWAQRIESHPAAQITGTPTLYGNRLYVTVASSEESQGINPSYECCTFRGSVAALDVANGAIAWKVYMIPDEPKTLGRNRGGSVRWGPSGAGIWSSPTIDAKRGLLYTATGNMYTEPPHSTSDAVVALELATGKMTWIAQITPNDIFIIGCGPSNMANCPDKVGPDFDFGNSPMLTTVGGRDLIVIGQKSGVGWALDPDRKGAIVWQYRAGSGGALGGMEFGSALDGEFVYFPVADGNQPTAGEVHAVRIATGERQWRALAPAVKCGQRGRGGCTPAILAAITAIPGVLFVGAHDGGVRAYSTADGTVLWEFDSNVSFTTVNGVAAKGGSIVGGGPAVADGMLFINSGYGNFGGRAGNVLLAFGLDE